MINTLFAFHIDCIVGIIAGDVGVALQFRCSHCNRRIKAPDAAAGQSQKCPSCGELVQVPLTIAELREASDSLHGFDAFMETLLEQSQIASPSPLKTGV